MLLKGYMEIWKAPMGGYNWIYLNLIRYITNIETGNGHKRSELKIHS